MKDLIELFFSFINSGSPEALVVKDVLAEAYCFKILGTREVWIQGSATKKLARELTGAGFNCQLCKEVGSLDFRQTIEFSAQKLYLNIVLMLPES